MAPGAVDERAQGVERPNRAEGQGADLGMWGVQVGQQRAKSGEGGQRADGLGGDNRTGVGGRDKRQQPEGGDAPSGVRGPRQLPPSASSVSASSLPTLRLRPLPPCVPLREPEILMVTRQTGGPEQ